MKVSILLMTYLVECAPNKVDLNLHVFNMITKINEQKTLRKHLLLKYLCKFDSKKCNWNQIWNND